MSRSRRGYPRDASCFVCGAPFRARSGRHILCGERSCRQERRRWRDRLEEPTDPAFVLAYDNGRAARRSCLELSANPFIGGDPGIQASMLHPLMARYWRAGWRAELAEQLRSAGVKVAPRSTLLRPSRRSSNISSAG